LAKRLAEIEPASIWHRFRIASVSKPITATAILRLVEQGRLGLADRVFGAGSRLGMDFGFGSLTPPAQNPGLLATITVQQLLEHTCGGWPIGWIDPMFSEPNLNQEQLITWVLQNRSLNDVPGSVWDYSNFGYCLLGRIIEHVSGQTYANFVQANILGPCGITTMAIAGDSLADRKSDEVTYEGHPFLGLPLNIDGKEYVLEHKDEPYRVPVSRMDSHGGWIATAVDLVRFAVHFDNFPTPPDILTPASMTTMTTPTTATERNGDNPKYAKGWKLSKDEHNWFHTGDLPGSSSRLVVASNGFCFAALANTRRVGSTMDLELDSMMWDFINNITWPTQNLFNLYDDPGKAIRWSS
jgi:CubicO group peptidase (beta-lactamase class C family)